jgi:predicted AlkP superfamily phosphohydrolase/phosphomutase
MTHAQGDHQPKVLIIGLDGATFDLIRPWAAAGKLPTFKRLLHEGVHGELTSTIPPVTAPAWSSFMTGKNPGKHGLYHFIEPQPGSYEVRYTNARSRLTKTIWQILSESGVRVGVLNVPMTYPPEPVRGYMISGMDSPEGSTTITYPLGLYPEIAERFGKVGPQIRYLGYLKTDERREGVLKGLEEMDAHYLQLTDYLLKKYPVDVAMVVFTSVDTVQHFFWQYMDRTHPQHDAVGAAKYGEAILRVYQRVDEIIAKLTADLPDESAVMVMSDHGFHSTSARIIAINQYLLDLGLLRLQDSSQQWYRPQTLMQGVIKKVDTILRQTLTPHQKAKISQQFPWLRSKWESHHSGLSNINWEQTKAFCYEILTFPSCIWINTKGLRPQGIVDPGAEYDELIQCVTDKLYELKDPATGRQLVSRIYHKQEIYRGPYLDQAPDLTLAWWDGLTLLGRPSFAHNGKEPIVRYTGGTPIAAGEWGGTHALKGILVLRGKPFCQGKALEHMEIIDLAPTLLYLLGRPIPEDMDGRVLGEAFTEEFRRGQAVVRLEAGEANCDDGRAMPLRGETYSDDEAICVEERLRGLGYIE